MAQNAIQNLIGNRDAIRQLMAMDSNGTMDRIAEDARKSGALSMNEEGVSFARQGGSQQIPSSDSSPVVVNEQTMKAHSRMPKQILESFKNNPGKTASNSVLGNIPDSELQKMRPKQQVSEATTYAQTSAPIDYSLLKTIINESVQENVKKYMSALSKKLINEGVGGKQDLNELRCMKLGNTFSFIDESGNVYEAELKFKKHIEL